MMESLEKRAVARCADEMARATMYLRALQGLYKAETYNGIDFIRLAALALHDQMIGHVIKVLYPGKDDRGLWYLIGKQKAFCAKHESVVDRLKKVSEKLHLIRNKTHFHLDKRSVRDPKSIWKDAGLSWSELEDAIDASLGLLCLLHKEIRGAEFPLPYYDGSDATRIAEHAYKHELLSTGKPVDPAFAALFA